MKKNILILLLIFSFLHSACADSNTDLLKKGNSLFQAGKFDEAIHEYQKILSTGYEAHELYFNLGNSYYKKGEIGSSILFYERALRLNPDDEDTKFNLRMAHSKIVDKITPKPGFVLEIWWKTITNLLSLKNWTFLTIFFNLLFAFALGFFIFSPTSSAKKLSFGFVLITLCALVFSFAASHRAHIHLMKEKFAIIFSPSVYVKSSPDEKSTDLFMLHEGTKIKLLDEVGGWYQVEIPDGNKGWTEKKNVSVI